MGAQHRAVERPKSRSRVQAHPDLRRDLTLAAKSGAGSLEAFYALPEAEDWIADWEIEQERCKFHGGPYSECPDADRDWFPQRAICYPTMQLEAVKGLYADLHKDKPYHDGKFQIWSEKRTKLTPFHYTDGVTIWLSRDDLSPDDDFLGNRPQPASGGPIFSHVIGEPPQSGDRPSHRNDETDAADSGNDVAPAAGTSSEQ